MDVAYDHITEESYPDDEPPRAESSNRQSGDFNTEIQEAYKAISASPWAARLGGFLGNVKKQGEQYTAAASKQATEGISSIISRTRAVSIHQAEGGPSKEKEKSASTDGTASSPHPDRPESLPADIVKEAEGILSRFRSEAAKRLKDIEKAEDAADEALLKFGTNIRSFLREAVTIAPPDGDSTNDDPSKVMFESKDSDGKRVIHTTRFDAQLHVIHSSLDSFLKDPVSPEWAGWAEKFDIDGKTEAISKDLEKHDELRRAMEKLVPEKVEYAQFWKRYYFLRHVIESEEQRRREMLKASAAAPTEEEVGWDEDSEDEESSSSDDDDDDEDEDEDEDEDDDNDDDDDDDDDESKSSTPHPHPLAASKETLKPGENPHSDLLKPESTPRRSNDGHSQADSDASYDLVSGATSRAPGSPKEAKKETVNEESDEEDWE